MIRPVFILVAAIVVMYVVVRFRALDERCNVMRRSLDTRVTDADVESMISMVREHLGGTVESRLQNLEERLVEIEEKIDLCSIPRKVDFEKCESDQGATSASVDLAVLDDDEAAPPPADGNDG